MADRFPSIEDIDEDQPGFDAGDALSGGDDFLARERAALGDDADQFGAPVVSAIDADGDLLGDGNNADPEIAQFQSSFPAVDEKANNMAPGGTIGASGSPFLPGAPQSSAGRPYSPAPPTYIPEDEPEVIKEWRAQRNAGIEKREEASSARKAETIEAAQGAIDEFYENYNKKKEKGIAQTRREAEEFLAQREDTSAGGTSWERIAKLVDVRGGKGQAAPGKEKFRELLGSLMKDEKAPGAKGY